MSLWNREWKWDRTIGNEDGGDPVFYIRTFFKKWGVHVDLHKFTKEDKADCYHTHPAYAIRIILEGGYIEEEYIETTNPKVTLKVKHTWKPGMIGLVKPAFTHRIHALLNDSYSYSLWLRGPVVAKIMLRGEGWTPEQRDKISSYQSKN